ncbi:hypothetical protein [Priestia megaterium]|uniref:hypothetical protein n=1 Tax=Priestia megaterium TaxID=1404 RepID=UPI0033961E30
MNPMGMGRFLKGASNMRGSKIKSMGSPLSILGGTSLAALDVKSNMDNGDDFITASMKATATTMLWSRFPLAMAGITAAQATPAMVEGYTQWKKGKEEWWNQQFHMGNVGGNYVDTQRALTMRQAAVQQIQGSKMNARSALGGEARILSENFHRS